MISTSGGSPPRSCTAFAARAIARTCISYTSGHWIPRRQPRVPSIGFDSVSALMRCRIRSSLRLLERRQKLVQRRVEQADRHRQPGHRLEDRLEVGLLEREEPVERVAAAFLVAGEDHLLHDGQPLLAEEHVLGAAEADALRAELARLRGVLGVVGVRAHLQAARVVGPLEERLEVLVDVGRHERNRADDDAAGARRRS